ncbi:T9SS type A sorting domain-containing protein [bacterium]|nr:T9SS type A sorting domain-containing protein [bacterium]
MKRILNLSLSTLTVLLTALNVNAQEPGPGSSYDFSSNTMAAPNSASLNPNNISIEAWIKADTWAANSWQNVIVSKDGWGSINEGYTLRSGANGTLSFNFSGAGTWREVASLPLMQIGKWYHVAGTYDGAMMRIYINGEEVGTTAYAGSITNGNYDLTIGGATYTTGGTRYFDGNIDEVRIWSESITEDEIKDYMCKKVDASHPSLAALLAHYTFDSPNFLSDNSPNGNNLTNVGATQTVSGAPIGDVSVHQYGGPYDLSLAYSTIDSIHVQSSNSISTIHLYRVDTAPNMLNAASTIDSMDYSHYYGVFVGSTASYNYTTAYNYYGNAMGITNASYLNLAGRLDASATLWSPQGASVNEPLTTVNKTFSNRTEMMLAIACRKINLNVTGTQNLCTGETLNAMDQVVNTNYQWHNASGPIASETNSSYTITTTGNYYLIANDGLCVDSSDVINVTINPIPTVNFGILTTAHCENDAVSSILNSTPSGGTYSGNGISGTDFNPTVAGAGSHTLYYNFTDGNGCSDVDSLVVDVYSQPAVPIITNTGGVLCVSSGGTGSVYQWSLNGNSVSSSTDTCYTALTNGDYTVTCASSNGCISDNSAAETVSGIGINENELIQAISISPNPTNGIINVQFEGLNSELTISLRDLNGRILQSKKGSNLIEFDLSDFESGIYFIDCKYADQRIVKRVVLN